MERILFRDKINPNHLAVLSLDGTALLVGGITESVKDLKILPYLLNNHLLYKE